MDHLDLDGIFSSSASSWILPFDQQDGNFLSASRQMLEPIMEETSEDEENQNWSQYENVWSSESDTGSVIRIELHNDQDSISERDFACPAKRPRRDDLLNFDESTHQQLRKYQQQQLQPQQQQQQRNDFLISDNNSDNFRKRFDEFYSDSDSLSYNSLSRSSSLIQFESLERQLQSDHGSSSIGNSSPSLLSFDAANNDINNKGSNSCLRRFESSDSRLHQTFYDLDKLDFENIFSEDRCNHHDHHHHHHRDHRDHRDHHSKSDSESSDNSILSHEERILKPRNISNNSDHRNCYKGKSSAENLSEDSGYCEHVSVLRIKSKSIPNFIRRTDRYSDGGDEFEVHKSLEAIFIGSSIGNSGNNNNGSYYYHDHHHHHEKKGIDRNKNTEILQQHHVHSRNENSDRHFCCNEIRSFSNNENKRNFNTKIDLNRRSSSDGGIGAVTVVATADAAIVDHHQQQNDENKQRIWYNGQDIVVKNKIHTTTMMNISSSLASHLARSSPTASTASSSSSSTSSSASSASSSFLSTLPTKTTKTIISPLSKRRIRTPFCISSSLPDVRIQFDDDDNNDDHDDGDNRDQKFIDGKNSNYKYGSIERFDKGQQFTTVSSVPNDLNLFINENHNNNCFRNNDDDDEHHYNNNNNQNSNSDDNFDDDNYSWNLRAKSTSPIKVLKSQNRQNDWNWSSTISTTSLGGSQSAKSLIKPVQNYLNISYNNLTLLDYSSRPSRSSRNSLTMSDCGANGGIGGNTKRNSKELELGKGNFLLDEISKHFDKNLSILNDRDQESDLVSRFLDEEKENALEDESDSEEQQEQEQKQQQQQQQQQRNESENRPKLPTRRSHSLKDEHTIIKELNKSSQQPSIQKKVLLETTFDQDPTILRTSYAESLEKCNFDPKELSNTDLRNIDNHSTPIKRGFVASTPNLNSFRDRNDDEIDDDLQVSSAHTSMNPIPRERKLGILLPIGSRNSLGKGVSFCPVVSEISWRDQSSEECMDPDSLENLQQTTTPTVVIDCEHNHDEVDTQTNVEHICGNNNSASNKNNQATCIQQHDYLRQHLLEQQNHELNEQMAISNVPIVKENVSYFLIDGVEQKTEFPLTSFSDSSKKSLSNKKSDGYQQQKQNNNQVMEKNVDVIISDSVSNNNNNYNNHNNNNNSSIRMSTLGVKSATIPVSVSTQSTVAVTVGNGSNNSNNNNSTTMTGTELLNTKFKPKPDEKHHKNGFLSRFAGGFRFSLRRKKKPIIGGVVGGDGSNGADMMTTTNSKNNELFTKCKPKKSIADGAVKSSGISGNVGNSQKSPDFIYIPLKDPLVRQQQLGANTIGITELPYNNSDSVAGVVAVDDSNERHLPLSSSGIDNNNSTTNNHVLLGKPPLPKQPPRVVGVCEKLRASPPNYHLQQQQPHQQQQQQQQGYYYGVGNSRHAPNGRSLSSQPREIDESCRFLLDNEREFYNNENQLNGTMIGNGCNSSSKVAAAGAIPSQLSLLKQSTKSPSRCQQQQQQQLQQKNIGAPLIATANTGGPSTNGHCKIGLIETNLDTHETVISGKTRSLMELGPQVRHTLSKQSACNDASDTTIIDGTSRRPHKSMEFLLDKENQKNILPPENELQKSHDSTAALSEHQLRVQASLQRLNIPDWFRQYSSKTTGTATSIGKSITGTGIGTDSSYKPGTFTRKRASDSGRWTGLNSKTTSLSSLGSQRSDRSPLLLSPSAHSHHGGQIGFSRWSTSYLNSTQTSPSVSTRGSFARGGPGNSSFISVGGGGGGVGGSTIRNSFRQPYLGWRSQEKLTQPRTPHERLASSLLSQKPPKPEPAVTPEIQSSIKEVTSAIVHYVNDQTNRGPRSRSTSPSSRKCWLESSFVGIRPVESPQTPIIENSFNTSTNTTTTSSIHSGITSTSDALRMNGVATPLPSLSIAPDRSSPSSASLEDVLASLLGLPTDTYRSTGDTVNEVIMYRVTSTTSPSNLQVDQNRFRRRSEGDAQNRQQQQQQQQQQQHHHHHQQQQQQQQQQQLHQHQQQQLNQHQQQQQQQLNQYQQQNPSSSINNNNTSETSLPSQPSRRVSLDSSESKTTSELFIKCRNTKCDQSANPIDAKKFYKSCHNCTHLYCSRECRRAHWEKHRKACLHSRVSNLCRQVLSSCKDDVDTLRHLSLLARKGYLSQGRGVVRVLFRSPENAEAFIKNGFQCLGEASYVRWPDLMPAEMGLELYSELLKLSTEYKPESKMLIYVAICVVSEAPGTATAPVKWERQLVSRCAKLKICKSILTELDQSQQIVMVPETSTEILILTFNPQKCNTPAQRELISANIQTILNRRGVILRKHYPEIYQRLQTYAEGQTDRFMPVTIHPRDNQSGQGFVCIMMPSHGDNELIKLPNSDSGNNKVITIDVGEELMES